MQQIFPVLIFCMNFILAVQTVVNEMTNVRHSRFMFVQSASVAAAAGVAGGGGLP